MRCDASHGDGTGRACKAFFGKGRSGYPEISLAGTDASVARRAAGVQRRASRQACMWLAIHSQKTTSLRSILFFDPAEFFPMQSTLLLFAYTCPLDPVARCHERKPRKVWHLSTLLSNIFYRTVSVGVLEAHSRGHRSILYTFDRVPMMSAAWAVLVLAAGAEAFGPQPAGLLHQRHAGASVSALSSRPSLRVGRPVGLKVCARQRVSRRRSAAAPGSRKPRKGVPAL
jgi:hypothetical protein